MHVLRQAVSLRLALRRVCAADTPRAAGSYEDLQTSLKSPSREALGCTPAAEGGALAYAHRLLKPARRLLKTASQRARSLRLRSVRSRRVDASEEGGPLELTDLSALAKRENLGVARGGSAALLGRGLASAASCRSDASAATNCFGSDWSHGPSSANGTAAFLLASFPVSFPFPPVA